MSRADCVRVAAPITGRLTVANKVGDAGAGDGAAELVTAKRPPETADPASVAAEVPVLSHLTTACVPMATRIREPRMTTFVRTWRAGKQLVEAATAWTSRAIRLTRHTAARAEYATRLICVLRPDGLPL